jgi:hypothetical protein
MSGGGGGDSTEKKTMKTMFQFQFQPLTHPKIPHFSGGQKIGSDSSGSSSGGGGTDDVITRVFNGAIKIKYSQGQSNAKFEGKYDSTLVLQ